MSTYMEKKGNVVRKWYVVDAAGKPLGKTAVIVADLLRGKGKPTYTPHADCGDNVIVINAGKAVLTGNKMEQKYYRTHSGWVGGLKETKYRLLMQEKPEVAVRVAVRGMMPRNIVTKDSLKRLHIYAGEQHEHALSDVEYRRNVQFRADVSCCRNSGCRNNCGHNFFSSCALCFKAVDRDEKPCAENGGGRLYRSRFGRRKGRDRRSFEKPELSFGNA